jgi:hypothetical protein
MHGCAHLFEVGVAEAGGHSRAHRLPQRGVGSAHDVGEARKMDGLKPLIHLGDFLQGGCRGWGAVMDDGYQPSGGTSKDCTAGEECILGC